MKIFKMGWHLFKLKIVPSKHRAMDKIHVHEAYPVPLLFMSEHLVIASQLSVFSWVATLDGNGSLLITGSTKLTNLFLARALPCILDNSPYLF
jgi:hypothetical protein